MAPLDLITTGAAGVAFLALALRGNMLKPEAKGWASSRPASLTIIFLSVVMAGEGMDVYVHGGVTMREAALVSGVAISSVAMLAHLWGQRQAPAKPEGQG